MGWKLHRLEEPQVLPVAELVVLPGMPRLAHNSKGSNAIEALNVVQVNSNESIIPMVGVVVSLVLFIVTGGMGVYSTTMAARNSTAVEEMFHGDNPYAYPSCVDNLQQLCGPLDYKILLPLAPTRRGDGTSFPVVGLGKSQPTIASSSDEQEKSRYGSAGV